MKTLKYLLILLCSVCMLGGCSGIHMADAYTMSVEPYRAVNDEDVRVEECTISFSDEVSITGHGAWYKGSDIIISDGGVYTISGDYSDGSIIVDTTSAVKLIFSDANISNPDGYAVTSSAERLIIATTGVNSLTGCGGEEKTAVNSAGTLLMLGIGNMTVNGGIFSCGGIRFGRDVSTFCEILRSEAGDLIPGTLVIG